MLIVDDRCPPIPPSSPLTFSSPASWQIQTSHQQTRCSSRMRHSCVEGDTSAFCRVFVIQPNMARLAAPNGGGEEAEKHRQGARVSSVYLRARAPGGVGLVQSESNRLIRFCVIYHLCILHRDAKSHSAADTSCCVVALRFLYVPHHQPVSCISRAPLSFYKSAGGLVVVSQRTPGTHVHPHPGVHLPTARTHISIVFTQRECRGGFLLHRQISVCAP